MSLLKKACQQNPICHAFCTWRIKTKPPSSPPHCTPLLLFFDSPLLARFSFIPFHLTSSSLSQLFCNLWVMPDNDLSCMLLCVYYMYVGLLPAPSPTHLLLRLSSCGCFLPTSSFCQFLFLWNSSMARSWKDCLDVLCNGADHSGSEVWCGKSTSSKTVADLTMRFFLESTMLINCLHSIKQGPCFRCHSCCCQETELI